MNSEVLCRHKDGSKFYLSIHAVRVGKDRYLGFCSDITSRKKTEEHVLKLSHAIGQSSSTIVITDAKGKLEFANPRFAELTGYTIEETIGKNPHILKSGKTAPEVYKELWRVITSGKEWRGEFCDRKKNGELYWVSVSISPVKNDKGVITNFIAVTDDITKQKNYQTQISGINDLSKHLIGIGTLEEKLRYITDGIVKLFGVDFARIWLIKQGDRCNSGCVHAMAENEEHACIQRDRCLHLVASSGRYTHIDGKMHRRVPFGCYKIGRVASGDNSKLLCNDITHDQFIHDKEWARNLGLVSFACYKLVSATKDPVGVMAVFSKAHIGPDEDNLLEALADTTSLLSQTAMAEKALLQSEKLKSIGTITAGISHEFNNLLAIISGNVQLLEDDYKDDKVLTDALRTIMKAADDGAEISSNMLKFTKTKPDTKEFISSDIREMIMQSIDFTKPRWKNEAQSRGIDYKIDTESMKSDPSIMCKPTEIREIFINLINNALDAMSEGGRISFSTWSVDDTVFVSTTDTGHGMPEDVKKNIFDPFFSTKGVKGTGLGLSMVYGIVTRHGGKVVVTSETGGGTTFIMQFPATNKKRNLRVVPDTKQVAGIKSLRVLVVDDEGEIRDIINQFLSIDGHIVKTVDNGADAILMAKREDFDLVLC
ncbi:MAG: PAS domain S-box protein, partial [Gammaproteobacteria bacterium]|nr:PAS domain S-box protein [Gammaproteobacteria bacterium]